MILGWNMKYHLQDIFRRDLLILMTNLKYRENWTLVFCFFFFLRYFFEVWFLGFTAFRRKTGEIRETGQLSLCVGLDVGQTSRKIQDSRF